MTANEIWTLGIAAYAAVISTFVLGWDAYKWLDSGPKIRLQGQMGMVMVGNGRVEAGHLVLITAFNRGDRPTTITNLGMLFYKNRWNRFRNKADQAFVITGPSDTQRLPYRFEAGAQWMGMANQDDKILEMATEGLLYAALYHSHSGKGVHVRLRPKNPKPRPDPE